MRCDATRTPATRISTIFRLRRELKPQRAFFTHMSHDLDHDNTEAELPPHVRLAYDGLQIHFEIA